MNRLYTNKCAQVVSCLIEGCSIRSTVRMTGVSKNTVAKLLIDLAGACAEYHDSYVRDLRVRVRKPLSPKRSADPHAALPAPAPPARKPPALRSGIHAA